MRRVVLAYSADNGVSRICSDEPPSGIYLISSTSPGDPAMKGSEVRRVQEHGTALLGIGDLELAELFSSKSSVPRMADDNSGEIEWSPGVRAGEFRVRIATFGPNYEASMHASRTFDLDIVISGDIKVVTEAGDEADLRTGDSVLIPGVRHGWKAGPEGCMMAIVMFGVD